MNTQRYLVLVAFAFLTASAVAQPPADPKPDDKTPETTKPIATFGGHATEVVALAFSADGRQVVSVSAQDVRFWQADSGKEIARKEILPGWRPSPPHLS